jgi:hypothetical protein
MWALTLTTLAEVTPEDTWILPPLQDSHAHTHIRGKLLREVCRVGRMGWQGVSPSSHSTGREPLLGLMMSNAFISRAILAASSVHTRRHVGIQVPHIPVSVSETRRHAMGALGSPAQKAQSPNSNAGLFTCSRPIPVPHSIPLGDYSHVAHHQWCSSH